MPAPACRHAVKPILYPCPLPSRRARRHPSRHADGRRLDRHVGGARQAAKHRVIHLDSHSRGAALAFGGAIAACSKLCVGLHLTLQGGVQPGLGPTRGHTGGSVAGRAAAGDPRLTGRHWRQAEQQAVPTSTSKSHPGVVQGSAPDDELIAAIRGVLIRDGGSCQLSLLGVRAAVAGGGRNVGTQRPRVGACRAGRC